MVHLTGIILRADGDAVTRELLEQGLLDFMDIREIDSQTGSRLEAVSHRVSLARLKELRKRIENFLDYLDLDPTRGEPLNIEKLDSIDLDAVEKHLDRLAATIQKFRERQKEAQQEILKLQDISRQVELFDDFQSAASANSRYSFLQIRAGTLPQGGRERFEAALKDIPAVMIEGVEEQRPEHASRVVHSPESVHPDDSDIGSAARREGFLLITLRRDESTVEKILTAHSWSETDPARVLGTSSTRANGGSRERVKDRAAAEIRRRIASLEKAREENRLASIEKIREDEDRLRDSWERLRLNELYYTVQSRFSGTARTMIFAGWLPASKRQSLETGIRRKAEGGCYLEWSEPEEIRREAAHEVTVPVRFRNPKILFPFQRLVENYAIPAYGMIDPTIFVMVSYLAMFGLMFGDAGHGLVLVVVGVLGAVFSRRQGKEESLFTLIIWCGGAAIAAGILFGSYFGISLFPPVWFDYHGIVTGHSGGGGTSINTVYDILGITIYFGIAVIGLGLVLNWINAVSRREYFRLVFDKAGLLGGWIYGAGVAAAFAFVAGDYKELPAADALVFMFGVPALILALKGPLERRRHDESIKLSMIPELIMEWLVELLEVFSGYLANTLSFMRVAGLGIAHVSLMVAFFSIAEMAAPDGGFSIASLLILVFGNALVIALEGLSAGIQSLRLNYYEFFSKYFTGTGRAYEPISLLRDKRRDRRRDR